MRQQFRPHLLELPLLLSELRVHPGNDILQEGSLLHRGFLLLCQTVLHYRERAELSEVSGELLHLLGDNGERPGWWNRTINVARNQRSKNMFICAILNERNTKVYLAWDVALLTTSISSFFSRFRCWIWSSWSFLISEIDFLDCKYSKYSGQIFCSFLVHCYTEHFL